jgi:hypothetical protein
MYISRLKKLLHKTSKTNERYEHSEKFGLGINLIPSEGCLCLSDLKYLCASSLICLVGQGRSRKLHPISLSDRMVKLKNQNS